VVLYEHDIEANYIFAQNGFGRRCVDAIRETTPINAPVYEGITFRQAGKEDAEFLTTAANGVGIHLRQSPMFMPASGNDTVEDTLEWLESGEYLSFIALEQARAVAYLCTKKEGENFAADDASVMNICGAYTLPEVRGKGISDGLLSWLMDWLRERGYTRCGVDYECFNPTSRKFWGKHFTPYTNGAVRRIDERINEK
jgi:GNAT superfamily N-acetyltransferase